MVALREVMLDVAEWEDSIFVAACGLVTRQLFEENVVPSSLLTGIVEF